jgi:chitinase
MGKKYELSFAAGGFQRYLETAVDWQKVMPYVNRVNIMSYDLVSGYATVTGHHTAVYSGQTQDQSTDRTVNELLKLGVSSKKMVIGAAFYARIWQNVADTSHGLYQNGSFYRGVDYKKYDSAFTETNGWQAFWDDKAQAEYWYNAKNHMFATGDDKRSVVLKTKYAIAKKLGGIMFWELSYDTFNNGLLDAIYNGFHHPVSYLNK